MLCDTSGVGERSGVLSTGSPFGHYPRLSMVCPLQGQWVRAGRFLFSLSPLIHGFALRASPAVTHSVSPAGDSGWTMSYFFSYQEIKLFGGVCILLVAALFVAFKNTIRA